MDLTLSTECRTMRGDDLRQDALFSYLSPNGLPD
jgi:hypothetical protein